MNNKLLLSIVTVIVFAMPTTTRLIAQEHSTKHHHYQLLDIGTLGGQGTWLAYPLPGEVQLNQRGLVVGISETADPDPYSPNCITSDCGLAHAFQWQNGILTDLGALPGSNNSFASWISANGLIAGFS